MLIRKIEQQDMVPVEAVYESFCREILSEKGRHPPFWEVSDGEHVYVACESGRILGLVSVWAPDRFIHFLMVDHGFRRKGVGSALLGHVAGVYGPKMQLKCLKRNSGALAFYRSCGFDVVGEGESPDGEYYLLESSGGVS